ncbi:taurine dioxygenase [Pseudoteredinibacter isoporae]|uniref:taurine dioxygenase n=1 Tax=Pseudoteredinibacter isoporae TaxID=570281 RepID=UPI003340BA5C
MNTIDRIEVNTMISVKPLAAALGAEISGIDLTQTLSENTLKTLDELLVKHQVIFFRDQDIEPAQHKALAEAFGPLQSHPAYDTVPDFPEITILESTPEKPTKIEEWHTDMTFRQTPPLGSILRSRIVPSCGGDTLWASLGAAYDGLSDKMQSFLSGLSAVHDFAHGFRHSLAEDGGRERLAKALAENPPVEHPVIRSHPVSGRKMIYVNSLFTTHIVGMTDSESQALLMFLYQHCVQDEYTCRFRWEENSIAFWDNRSTLHKPINDYFPAHRRMERITIDGDRPSP